MPGTDTPARKSNVVVGVRIEDLVEGRSLVHPLYDDHGLLLLAAGSRITPTFKKLLVKRGLHEVLVSEEDRDRVTSTEAEVAHEPEPISLHVGLTRPLDEIVENGALFVANTGTPVRELRGPAGCRAYDPELVAEFVRRRDDLRVTIGHAIDVLSHGGRLDGSRLVTSAGEFATGFVEDGDCVAHLATTAGADGGIAEHCLRMSLLAMAIGVEVGLDERNLGELGVCGLLHDWGMVRVPEELRSAERVLTREEFQEIRKHPIHTLEMIDRVDGLPPIAPLACYQVHEQPNGGGYPCGRRGSAIHLFARILRVADIFAGMTERRPHRPPFSAYSAMECLVRLSNEEAVDARIVRDALRALCLFPVGSFVRLKDDRTARVLRANREAYTLPTVEIVDASDGRPTGVILDLADGDVGVERALPTPGSDEVLLTPDKLLVDRD